MGSLNNGMSLMNVPTFYQDTARGVVLLLAVALDQLGRRSAEQLADALLELGDQLHADLAAFALDALGQDQVDGVEMRLGEVEVLCSHTAARGRG